MSAKAPFEVLIPERGRPDLLGDTLQALAAARAQIDVPHRVRVLVNGAPAGDYLDLQRQHADIQWSFVDAALGFHGAVTQLLQRTNAPWVYLLNSDMRLAEDALRTILPWRAPDVFAIASQIEWADRTRRREETGYTVPVRGPDGQLELHDRLPPDDSVRGHIYAGGGASLFQSAVLRRFLGISRAYQPFYFEDADWGLQAWAEGFAVLYCGASRATHVHRGTIGRYLPAAMIERIVRRNLEYFRWRYGDLFGAPRWHGGRGDRLRAWLRGLRPEHARARRRVCAAVDASPQHLPQQRYPHPQRWRKGLPRVLLVSPFALLPPAHGGARRIVELARASAAQVDWIALHDEGAPEPQSASPDDAVFRQIHPVMGRPDSTADPAARWQAHAHHALRAELSRMLKVLRPDLVCFEHIESIGLIETVDLPMPCIWTLHDAGRDLPQALQARVRATLSRVDALVLTTTQDLGYWQHRREVLIENGVRLPTQELTRSPDRGYLLLLAPLRYAANLQGLRLFLDQAWPNLQARYPWLRLRVLAGAQGERYWGEPTLPAGVELIAQPVDPASHYESALLALNPQGAIEGSALKLAEALAHRRVMVTTASGARGYEALQTPALVRTESVAAMVEACSALIEDPPARHRAEAQALPAITPWCWAPRGERLVALIAELGGAGSTAGQRVR